MMNTFLIAGISAGTSLIVSIITSRSVSRRAIRKAKLSYNEGIKSANRKRTMNFWKKEVTKQMKENGSAGWQDAVSGTAV